MTYNDVVEYFFSQKKKEIKLGLNTMYSISDSMGRPHLRLKNTIHIAGTNGKGSTASIIASILQESGFKVGLFTSPHVRNYRERIKVNGIPISEEKILAYANQHKPIFDSTGATFFEITTALAYKYFAEEEVDIAVIEVGLGGRLDATNILSARHVVITPIGYDHTTILGNTLTEIANEKSGIIKHRSKVFIAKQHVDVLEAIVKTARFKKATTVFTPAQFSYSTYSQEVGMLHCSFNTAKSIYIDLHCPLWGSYQLQNIQSAVLVAEEYGCNSLTIRKGIANVIANTGHRGRLEILSTAPTEIIDVSHNPDGIAVSMETLNVFKSGFKKRYVIFAVMADKNVKDMLQSLSSFADEIVFVPLKEERALSVELISAIANADGLTYKAMSSVSAGLNYVRGKMKKDDALLITGSFYLAQEVLEIIEPMNFASSNTNEPTHINIPSKSSNQLILEANEIHHSDQGKTTKDSDYSV